MSLLTRSNKNFPKTLINSKIQKLYFKGNLELLRHRSIAIVGSRKCSEEGKNNALRFSKALSESGYAIVSGLAIGIDSYAHMASLENTIAILPSGIGNIYPKENKLLSQEIVSEGGLLLSEYEDEIKVQLKSFSRRNELIAKLSDLILVIEAGERSGSTLTARQGFKLGKSVFCIPGRLSDEKYKGNNLLISQGAHIALNPDIIIDYLESELSNEELVKSNLEFEKLNEQTEGIYGFINNKPISMDQIAKLSNLSFSTISEKMMMLEISGKIRRLPGEKYILNN